MGQKVYPSDFLPHTKRLIRPDKDRVELMAERLELGLDIWTGEPLDGTDAENWARLQDRIEEYAPVLTPAEIDELTQLINQCNDVYFFLGE